MQNLLCYNDIGFAAISFTRRCPKMDNQSIAHTRWNCTYHIVFIPKYRRKVVYGEVRWDIAEILKKLCEMKQIYVN